MASHYFAIDLGEESYEVSSGAATQAKTVEIAVDLADGATRSDVVIALAKLQDYILRGVWPPA